MKDDELKDSYGNMPKYSTDRMYWFEVIESQPLDAFNVGVWAQSQQEAIDILQEEIPHMTDYRWLVTEDTAAELGWVPS